jgi:hypothetical protein
VPSRAEALAKTVALRSLHLAIRFWPAESRHWGRALLAELYEVTRPSEALHWAVGGITVFLRSHLSHAVLLLRLAPGQAPNGARHTGSQPKNPRYVTALVFLAIALLFVFPSNREATRIVASSWRDFESTPDDQRIVERLAASAEKDRDGRQLAFLANCEPDSDRAEQFADRAVELDPGLVWVLASRFRRPDMRIRKDWVSRLRDSDPDNAFVHLLEAESAVISQVPRPVPSSVRTPARLVLRIGPPKGFSPPPAVQGEWTRHMEQALGSRLYDSYARRHLELTREGWTKTPEVPLSLLVYSFWSHPLPDLTQMEGFVDEKIEQAQEEAAAGHPDEAEKILKQTATFGQRFVKGSQTDFERLGALEISRRAQQGLQRLYGRSNRKLEEQAAAAELRELEKTKELLIQDGMKSRSETWAFLHPKAVLVQASAWFTLILGALTMASLILSELGAFPRRLPRPAYSMAARFADFGPPAVLVSAACFLLSFKPFAAALAQYRSAAPSDAATADLVWQMMALGFMRPFLYFYQPSGEATLWLILIGILSLIALWIVARGIWRRPPTARTA